MRLITQLLTQNDCYRAGRTITPRGVMVHSTGADNPWLSRYVAPDDGLLGAPSSRHWNQSGTGACPHGFIGKLEDGSVAVCQTLPWTMRGWHAGKGSRGSANDTHISFEICEDGLEDRTYFEAVYRAAVELTAYLCQRFDLDPLADGVVICHSEGHARGIASNHADVMHWFPKFGKSMDTFRNDVAREMNGGDNLTEEDVRSIVRSELERIEANKAALGPSPWAASGLATAVSSGITDGTRPQCNATRQEVALMVQSGLKLAK